jgi:hypothetical protein
MLYWSSISDLREFPLSTTDVTFVADSLQIYNLLSIRKGEEMQCVGDELIFTDNTGPNLSKVPRRTCFATIPIW